MLLNWLKEACDRRRVCGFSRKQKLKVPRLFWPRTIRVPLSDDMGAYVDRMATRYGVPATEFILRALFTFRFLNSALERDGVLVIEYANGEVETIVKL